MTCTIMTDAALGAFGTGLLMVYSLFVCRGVLPPPHKAVANAASAVTASAVAAMAKQEPSPFDATRRLNYVLKNAWPFVKALPANARENAWPIVKDKAHQVFDNAAYTAGAFADVAKDKTREFGKHVPEQWAAYVVCSVLVFVLSLIILSLILTVWCAKPVTRENVEDIAVKRENVDDMRNWARGKGCILRASTKNGKYSA